MSEDINYDADDYYGDDVEYEDDLEEIAEDGGASKPNASRRLIIKGLAVGGVVAAGGAAFTSLRDKPGESFNTTKPTTIVGEQPQNDARMFEQKPTDLITADAVQAQEMLTGAAIAGAAPVAERILVLVELKGGSDGLDLLIPYNNSTYYNQRPTLAVDQASVHQLDNEVGLHPSLERVSQMDVTTVEGVGAIDGTLSHFTMAASWERGDVKSSKEVSTGFCGRVADALNKTNGFAGVSVAGNTNYFSGGRIPALFMNQPDQLNVITTQNPEEIAFRTSAQALADPIGSNWTKLSEMGAKFNGGLEGDPDSQMIRRGKDLGRQLSMAAEIIKADVGVKVVYANLGSFDTHDNHERRLRFLWEEFDYAVSGLYELLDAAGVKDRVLLATTSEFGRRVKQNGRGTDHGAASNLLMVGPMAARRLGQYPSLTNTDTVGNLKTEVPFDRYYATLAQDWLGVEAASILPGNPEPLGLL